MGTEIELKLSAAPKILQDVSRLGWLRKLASGPARREKLVSVYFDTRKFKLRKHGVTLRIRKIRGKHLQTIKTVQADGAAFGRGEWETEVAGETPDFSLIKGTALE